MDLSRYFTGFSGFSKRSKIIKIEPLAPVSAIERHLVMKGFGQPQTESSSGPEDNMSDSDDDNDTTPVSYTFIIIVFCSFLDICRIHAWSTSSWTVDQGKTTTPKYNHLSGVNLWEKKVFLLLL